MKRALIAVVALAGMLLAACSHTAPTASSQDVLVQPAAKGGSKSACTTIQSGALLTSDGQTISTGFDSWGYNYGARLFNGLYCDAYRDAAWCQAYKTVHLSMKWNEAWLDNKDCDDDGLLDRHYGSSSYIGSGAWITNHMSGGKGKDKWTYFVKIVAAPADAVKSGGVWYSAAGDEIGPVIWGDFAILQEVESGQGVTYKSPVGPGFGKL